MGHVQFAAVVNNQLGKEPVCLGMLQILLCLISEGINAIKLIIAIPAERMQQTLADVATLSV